MGKDPQKEVLFVSGHGQKEGVRWRVTPLVEAARQPSILSAFCCISEQPLFLLRKVN